MTEESRDSNQGEVKAAMERYPGIPLPLAVAKYMMDEMTEGGPVIRLAPGLGWGGVHLERVGALVQKLTDALYHQYKKSITIKIEAQDFPETWDHIWVEVKAVEGGTQGEEEQMGLAGWPCCCCDEVIRGDDGEAGVVLLKKLAPWNYPTWGSIPGGTRYLTVAVRCGKCARAAIEPTYAIKKVDDHCERVPISELEDADA